VWGWGIVGVRRVYEGDQEFEVPTVMGADGSIQPAYGPHGLDLRLTELIETFSFQFRAI
jgi:hypothetical protein